MLTMTPPSHADGGITEAMLAVVRYRYQVMLAMTLLRRFGRGAISMSRHASDSVAKSYWRQHC
jgi:hypothetical protein